MQPQEWLDKVVKQYQREKGAIPPPQLSVASWITAGLCTQALFNIATGKEVKRFPNSIFHPCFNSEAGMDEGNHSSL